ncbi:MAG: hypothetical protein U0Q15_19410 [Kineosporiaceae bacterium]
MAITENDLRDLFRERGDDLPLAVTSAPGRLDSVRQRVVRRRRRRAAAGGALMSLALVAGGAAWTGQLDHWLTRRHESMPAAPSAPEWFLGSHLIGSTVLDGDHGSASFTVVPQGRGLTVGASCSSPDPKVSVVTRIGTFVLGIADCASSGSAEITELDAAAVGLRPGEPLVVTATLSRPVDGIFRLDDPPPPLASGELPRAAIRSVVYEKVPRSQYRFPPRPATLAQVSPPESAQVVAEGRTDGAVGSRSRTVQLTPGASLVVGRAAPGVLKVRLNGVDTGAIFESWDYTDRTESESISAEIWKALALPPGRASVTVTVEASDFTIPAWYVAVLDAEETPSR